MQLVKFRGNSNKNMNTDTDCVILQYRQKVVSDCRLGRVLVK